MSFCYIGIVKKCNFFVFFYLEVKLTSLTIYRSPANEFLLHKCTNKFFFFSNLKIFSSPANEFLLHNRNNSKMKK